MTKSKIGTLEAIMLVLTIVVTHTISSLPREILVSTKSASLINLVVVSSLVIIFACLISTSSLAQICLMCLNIYVERFFSLL